MSTMRALGVQEWGQTPIPMDVQKPTQPTNDSQVQIKIIAAGLPNLVRSQASGKHYSSATTQLPYIPGADGVGIDSLGEYVYFSSVATGGAFAEYINVPKAATYAIPFSEGASDEEKTKIAIRVAGIFNPAMAGWLGLKTRTNNLPENYTVLINGVTSLSGQIAISHARALGAGKVIGVARNEDTLKKLELDQYIVSQDDGKTDYASHFGDQHIDVILDFVYGSSTLQLLQALPSNAMKAHDLETQYVQIGSLGGLEMDVPSALLRSRNLTIRGSGPGSWSVTKDCSTHFPGLLKRLVEGVGDFPVMERKLEDVEDAWNDKKTRSVFVI